MPEVERDIGKEVLYQATQQGFNELLDILFKPKEDLLMQVYRTRTERKIWAREIERFEKRRQRNGNGETEIPGELAEAYIQKAMEELLSRPNYSEQNSPLDPARGYSGGSGGAGSAGVDDANRPVLAPPSDFRLSDVYDDDDDNDDEEEQNEDFDEDDYEDEDEEEDDDDDDDVRPTHLAHPDGEEEMLVEDDDEEEQDQQHRSQGLIEPIPIRPVTPELQTSQYESQRPSSSSTLQEFDPTLPQHRPDATAIATPTNTNGLPLPLRLQPNPSLPSSSPEAEATAPKQPPSPIHALPPPSSASPSLSPSPSHAHAHAHAQVHGQTHQHPLAPPSPERALPRPSSRTLSRWAFLNQVERESKERGGTGARLNFEEFSKRMAVDRSRKLAFVASWIEMASF